MAENGGIERYQPQTDETTEDYDFESTAKHLGIPENNWSNESVREFVGFFNRVQQLQQDLSEAKTSHLRRSGVGNLFGTPAEDLQQEAQEVGGMDPSLSTRYGRGELLMRVALEVLRDGFNGEQAHPDYITSKLNAAVNGLGLEVSTSPQRPKP